MEREAVVVFELTRAFFGQTLCLPALPGASEKVDWTQAKELAVAHGVASLCHEALLGLAPEHPLRVQGTAVFRRERHLTAYRNARMAGDLVCILDALGSRGIRPILLKGAALALTAYPDPSLRPMGDLDLLVRGGEIAAAQDALIALGYEPSGEAATRWDEENLQAHLVDLVAPGRGPVEIHFRLFPKVRPLFPGEEDVWDRAVPFPVEGRAALRLAPEDELLYLCGHLRKHSPDEYRLLWFCDIALAFGRLTGEERTAFDVSLASHPKRKELGDVLRTVRVWFLGEDGAAPHGARVVMDSPLTAAERALPEALNRMGDLLGHMPTWPQRIRFVVSYLFPRLGYLRQFHGANSDLAAWGWRAIRPPWAVARAFRSYMARRRRMRER
jgi:hypothetical protein